MLIKRKIKFELKSKKSFTNRIRMRVSYAGKRMDFQTGIVVQSDYWDADKQRVKSSYSGNMLSVGINDHLSALMVKMVNAFHKFEQTNEILAVVLFP